MPEPNLGHSSSGFLVTNPILDDSLRVRASLALALSGTTLSTSLTAQAIKIASATAEAILKIPASGSRVAARIR